MWLEAISTGHRQKKGTAMTETPRILRSTIGLAMVLQHAHDLALPMPFDVTAVDYSDRIKLGFHTLDDLTEWAVWLDAVIEESEGDGRTHHRAEGQALEQPIAVWCITPSLVAS